MSLNDNPPTVGKHFDNHGKVIPTVEEHDSASSLGKGEIFSLESVDPALNAKMHLVNNVG